MKSSKIWKLGNTEQDFHQEIHAIPWFMSPSEVGCDTTGLVGATVRPMAPRSCSCRSCNHHSSSAKLLEFKSGIRIFSVTSYRKNALIGTWNFVSNLLGLWFCRRFMEFHPIKNPSHMGPPKYGETSQGETEISVLFFVSGTSMIRHKNTEDSEEIGPVLR